MHKLPAGLSLEEQFTLSKFRREVASIPPQRAIEALLSVIESLMKRINVLAYFLKVDRGIDSANYLTEDERVAVVDLIARSSLGSRDKTLTMLGLRLGRSIGETD